MASSLRRQLGTAPWLLALCLLAAAPRAVSSQQPAVPPAVEETAANGESQAAPAATTPSASEAEEAPPDDERADDSWHERIVVTATRSDQPLGEIPLHVTVIEREQIELAPELGLRDLFKRVPSINLATEDSTITAGPVDGGIAFRGLGGTAQSRSLVLVDGLPINDPSGSYILWARIPKDTIDRIEVVPGAGGAWGNLALSGVVNILTRAPTDRALGVKLKLAELDTGEATLHYSDLGDAWSGWLSGNAFDSDGYITLAEPYRAPIDTPSRTEYQTYTGKLGHSFSVSRALHLSAAVYDENRDKGTRQATDTSTENALSGMLELVGDRGIDWQLRLFGRDVGLAQNEGAADSGRASEILNATLDAPSTSYGLGAVRLSSPGTRHSLTLGGDLLLTAVEATARFAPVADRFTQQVVTEGEQQFAGVFAQDLFEVTPRMTLLLGARFDVLTTLDGRRVETDIATGQSTTTTIIERNTETTFNPSAGLVYELTPTVSLRSSAYTGFRAPTASELFVNTIGRNKNAANPELLPERLVGGEVGVDFTPSRRASTRATAHWSEGRDLIERILIGRGGPGGSVIDPCGFVAQGATCRERQNLGKLRARGVEIEQEVRLAAHWSLGLFGALLESEVTENPANPAFVGTTNQNTPEQAGTLSVTYANPRRLSAVARVSHLGDRWDDAANELLLEEHTLVDLSFSRSFGERFTVFAGVTNLFDEEYVIAESGEGPDLGLARMVHAGVRFGLF